MRRLVGAVPWIPFAELYYLEYLPRASEPHQKTASAMERAAPIGGRGGRDAAGLLLQTSEKSLHHLTAELGLISTRSRRDAPASTASISRSRKSPEYDLGTVPPFEQNRCA